MLMVRSRAVLPLAVGAGICLSLLLGRQALAGGGPENVILVVNARSWASLAIAHHYASLRQIPANNIMYLDWPYSPDRVEVDVFRSALLTPIAAAIKEQGLTDQIDYWIYSSDFPTSIDFKSDLAKEKLPENFSPIGSITSLTYASPQIVLGNYKFLGQEGNHYMRRPASKGAEVKSQPFHSWYGFDSAGKVVEGGGDRYFLSTMLGVTSGHGNSVDEVIDYLRRSTLADGTQPKGTIYFCKNTDVRSTTRDDPKNHAWTTFAAAEAALKKLGVAAEIVDGVLPRGKKDVQGAVVGARTFEWKESKSTILPGAICENFTSYGAIFGDNDQTRLTEFLRYGAAGSSGTVVEPYAIAEKFPSAFVQVHYARGCTLAESFYQSVFCPFQLLIVGDPLCRPWANIPRISVDGIQSDSAVSGQINFTPQGVVEGGTVDRFEAFIDGVRVNACKAGESLRIDTTKYPDGAAELRVVGIESGPAESQGRLILPIRIDNHSRSIDFKVAAGQSVRWRQPIKITVNSPGAGKILIVEGSRLLHAFDGDKGEMDLKPDLLGTGPVTLQAKARLPGETKAFSVVSKPVSLVVEGYKALPGRPRPANAKPLVPGLQFLAEGGKPKVIPRTNESKWLLDTEVKKNDKFILASIFRVATDGMHQFQVKHVGPITIKIDGATIYEGDQKTPTWRYVPVALGAGLHHFEMRATGGQPSGLEVRFGGQGATHLDGKQFQHLGSG